MTVTDSITEQVLYDIAYEANRRAAIALPVDGVAAFRDAHEHETRTMARFILGQVLENAELAVADDRPMCGDTGLPRYYVKAGNDARIEGGFIGMERAFRQAVADATHDLPLRANRVHPLTRKNAGNNVGVFAPSVDYSFEPDADWLEVTVVHKGGLFGTDYRMLFPADGTDGVKRFLLDNLAAFARRGLSCPPVVIGVGLGGAKDQCVSLSKEAACLRMMGDSHPDPDVAALEQELLELANKTGFGVMGVGGDTTALDVHVEVAYTHTGGLPVAISQFCLAYRRATVRVEADGTFEFRDEPGWFTPYYRREGIDWAREMRPDEMQTRA
ncbi:MAG: fumarate hydratase [SAR202 cluster bacterium]|nr:fumarate hydratase [SAR202 cluster bacterium]MDP6301567.1 fumarate hydratase [SAR202 cluster bacterium]MDP7103445.1 fumarate hydratase [SAR202 cluster bacterium]MDP7532756.1 fumarate hydratase [SAR202 cluster bacterium]